jgi:hypothetical protein
MARVPNAKSAKRSATRGRSQVVAKTKAGTRGAAKPMAPARTVSKDELRSQVEKLERANAALRAKNRQANRAAKLSAARISELEDEVARLRPHPGASTGSSSAAMPESGPQPHDIDPGDAVPPGVASEDPGLPDHAAQTARGNLESHLRGE